MMNELNGRNGRESGCGCAGDEEMLPGGEDGYEDDKGYVGQKRGSSHDPTSKSPSSSILTSIQHDQHTIA